MSGLIGIKRPEGKHVSSTLMYGLYALQHRGQINAGIGIFNRDEIFLQKGKGQIKDVFKDEDIYNISGNMGLGHVKYGVYEKYDKEQRILPEKVEVDGEECLIAIDGNILNENFNITELARKLSGKIDELIEYIENLEGAFSILFINKNRFIGIRDRLGLKPLHFGREAGELIFASETCALDTISVKNIKEVKPGEIIVCQDDNINSYMTKGYKRKNCAFEYIYVSRPDSYLNQKSIYTARNRMGKILYEENPTKADIVMGAPDSGLIAAIGYAEASKIPYKDGIIKNRYIGRTFINPDEKNRIKDVFIKLNPIKEVLKDKTIILVDDSVIKGITIKRTVDMLKNAGAKEVHVRISSPPVKYHCNLSLDLPKHSKLIAADYDIEEMRKEIGADSLSYLSIEGLKRSLDGVNICSHCFNGEYPIKGVKNEINL